MALESIEPSQNFTLTGNADPAFAMTATAFAPASQEDLDPAIEMQAENEAAALQSLAQRINEEANAPGISDEHKAKLQSLASTCMSKVGELRMGTSSAKSMALMGASAIYAQAFTQASGIEKQEKMEDEQEAALQDGSVSEKSYQAARADFLMYDAIAANRMRARIEELGPELRQGVVALSLMKSQTAEILWENREDEARKLGYEKGSPEYDAFIERTMERALAVTRGEGREKIFESLTPEQKEHYLKTHPDPYDRTQDDASYASHYENAKRHALEGSGWSAADVARLEGDPSLYAGKPEDKGKDFLVALKMDPDEARKTLEKYGADLTKEELQQKLKDQGLSDADIQKEMDNYLRARITNDFHQSMNIEDGRLRDTMLLANAQERDIEELRRAGKISEQEAQQRLEQLQTTTMQRIEAIRGDHLSPGKFEEEKQSRCENPTTEQQALTCGMLKDEAFGKKAHHNRETHAERDHSDEHARAAEETKKHIAALVDKGILPVAYAPEPVEQAPQPERAQAAVTSSAVVMAALLQAEGFKGLNLAPANMNHSDAFAVNHNAAMAEGHVKHEALTVKL